MPRGGGRARQQRLGLGEKLRQAFPHLPRLHRLRRHALGQQGLLRFLQLDGKRRIYYILIDGPQGVLRALGGAQGQAQALQRLHQGGPGGLCLRPFLRRAPGKGSEPQLSANAIGKQVVFQGPGRLLPHGAIAGFNQIQHIAGGIAVGRGAKGGEQKARRAVAGGGQLSGNIGGDAVIGKHSGQYAGKARVPQGDGHFAKGHAPLMEQQHFLGGKMRLEIGIRGCVEANGLLRPLKGNGGHGEIAAGKMIQLGRAPGRSGRQQQKAAGNPLRLRRPLQPSGAFQHRGEIFLPPQRQQHVRLPGALGKRQQQAAHLPRQHVEAVNQRPRPLGEIALRDAGHQRLQHVLAVHKLSGQVLRVGGIQQGQILKFILFRPLGQGAGVFL